MMKTIIHVNQQAIADNAKHGTTLPILSVWQGEQEQRCSMVEINGPSRVRYCPNERLPSGASTWIETESDVTLHGVQPSTIPFRISDEAIPDRALFVGGDWGSPEEPQCP